MFKKPRISHHMKRVTSSLEKVLQVYWHSSLEPGESLEASRVRIQISLIPAYTDITKSSEKLLDLLPPGDPRRITYQKNMVEGRKALQEAQLMHEGGQLYDSTVNCS